MAADEQVDVVIIGGGISGLATAWYVLRTQPGLRVAVLESDPTVGGKIAGATVAGHEVDCGPDAFLARVPGGVELASELGLGDDLVAPATGKAWVWSRGRLRALPEGLVLGAPSRLLPLARSGILSPLGAARAALDEVWPRSSDSEDDPTVAEAIGHHLGREVVDRLVDPLLGGINASDCDRLSLASAAPNLVASAKAPRMMRALRAAGAAQQRGQIGVDQDRPVFLTPRAGVRSLIRELERQLPLGTVRTSQPVAALSHGPDGAWTVRTANGSLIRAHTIVLATPAFVAAALLATESPQASTELQAIRTSSVALTLLAYPADRVDLPPGSGMLVPRVEDRLVTASSWWNQKWPHLVTPGHVLVRASAGRDGDTRFTDLDDDELVRALHQDLRHMLDIRAEPVDAHVARWMHGFPQYERGHAARVARVEAALTNDAPGLMLAGASYNGIGLPACVRSAKAAAARVPVLPRSAPAPRVTNGTFARRERANLPEVEGR